MGKKERTALAFWQIAGFPDHASLVKQDTDLGVD